MRRNFPLIAILVVAIAAAACTNPTSPRGDEGDEEDPYCGVVVGSHTRCDTTDNG